MKKIILAILALTLCASCMSTSPPTIKTVAIKPDYSASIDLIFAQRPDDNLDLHDITDVADVQHNSQQFELQYKNWKWYASQVLETFIKTL